MIVCCCIHISPTPVADSGGAPVQAWHADNEFAKMDAHYRRQLEGLVAEKRSADEELAVLRAAIGGQHPAAAGAPVGGQHPAAAGAGGAAPGQGVRAVANAGQKGASGAAAAASSGSGGTSPATRPPEVRERCGA
jgi:hypothetical protein